MGVLNVTPDSFSDGRAFLDPGLAEARAMAMQDEGAHLIDIGGESSRPGARTLGWKEEWARLEPVLLRVIPRSSVPISIDTRKPEVARAALDLGAQIINDICALSSVRMARTVARYGASVVLMHMQGHPKDMQKDPRYRNVVREVRAFLGSRALRAREAGIPRDRILIDPGFGFGKTVEHNFLLLSGLDHIATLGYPVLAGLSRKSFLAAGWGLPPAERQQVSVAAATAAIARGAHVLRVHDVRTHRQAASIADRVFATRSA